MDTWTLVFESLKQILCVNLFNFYFRQPFLGLERNVPIFEIKFIIFFNAFGKTHIKKSDFLVVGPLGFCPPPHIELVVHATFFYLRIARNGF